MEFTYNWQTKPLHDDETRVKKAISLALSKGKLASCKCNHLIITVATDPLGSSFGALVKCQCGRINTRYNGTTNPSV